MHSKYHTWVLRKFPTKLFQKMNYESRGTLAIYLKKSYTKILQNLLYHLIQSNNIFISEFELGQLVKILVIDHIYKSVRLLEIISILKKGLREDFAKYYFRP